MASQLPGARAAIADNQGLPTPEFYRFLLGLQRLSAGSATSADIAALQTQITAIQSEIDGLPKSSFPTLQVAAPVYSQGLLQNGFAKIGVNVADSVIVNGTALQLDGDTAAPGNTYLYSTGLTGAKGWNALSGMLHPSANVAVTFGTDGTATFDLQPLTDSGAGTFKLITRDSYGRLAGTKAGTTSDVPEGTNLYFTAPRVLATVLAGLSTATNAVITAADTVLSALGKLQAQISANVTALAGKLTAANNLSDVANAATARGNLGVVIPPGYIDGLQMVWNSATSISVTSGTAYIPSLANVLVSNATLTLSGLTPAASTWYHVYLYSNAGTPAIECVTTAPVLYNGTAYQKTGDASRRYVGSVLGTGSGITAFYNSGNFVSWRSNGVILLNQFNSPIAGNPQIIDLSSAMPVTAQEVVLRLQNNSSSTNAQLGPLPWEGPVFPIPAAIAGASGFTVIAQMSAPMQQIGANTAGGTPNNNLQVLVMAYIYQR